MAYITITVLSYLVVTIRSARYCSGLHHHYNSFLCSGDYQECQIVADITITILSYVVVTFRSAR